LAAWRPLAGVELFGGPVLSFLNYEEGTNDKLVSNFIWERSKYGNFHGIYLGYMGGIQINL
jgi:hypothetical protein